MENLSTGTGTFWNDGELHDSETKEASTIVCTMELELQSVRTDTYRTLIDTLQSVQATGLRNVEVPVTFGPTVVVRTHSSNYYGIQMVLDAINTQTEAVIQHIEFRNGSDGEEIEERQAA